MSLDEAWEQGRAVQVDLHVDPRGPDGCVDLGGRACGFDAVPAHEHGPGFVEGLAVKNPGRPE